MMALLKHTCNLCVARCTARFFVQPSQDHIPRQPAVDETTDPIITIISSKLNIISNKERKSERSLFRLAALGDLAEPIVKRK